MQGRYIHPLDETKRTAKLKGKLFSDVSSLASELVRHPGPLDEVLPTSGSDDGRTRVGDMTDWSSSVLFLNLRFDNIDAVGQILSISSVVDASGSSSPHPAQETALLAGMNRSSPSKTSSVVLQERTPRNTPGWHPRDRPRAFRIGASVLGGVDQPDSQCGERRRGGRVRGIRGTWTLHTLDIIGRRGGSRIFAQSSICVDWNWFETEVCGRDLLSCDPVTATISSRVRKERPLRIRIGGRAHVRRIARETWGTLGRRGCTWVPLSRGSASGSRRTEANRRQTFNKTLDAR